jgi:hypothetical protein
MLIAPLPFDYATLLDRGDRIRRTRKPPTGIRVRTPTHDTRRSR